MKCSEIFLYMYISAHWTILFWFKQNILQNATSQDFRISVCEWMLSSVIKHEVTKNEHQSLIF